MRPGTVNLFEAFGGIEQTWGNSDNNRLANTKERDASIALDNHGFRYYDASIGRYISNDPIGYEGGFNLYVHCTNDPVNKFDPLGLATKGSIEYKQDRKKETRRKARKIEEDNDERKKKTVLNVTEIKDQKVDVITSASQSIEDIRKEKQQEDLNPEGTDNNKVLGLDLAGDCEQILKNINENHENMRQAEMEMREARTPEEYANAFSKQIDIMVDGMSRFPFGNTFDNTTIAAAFEGPKDGTQLGMAPNPFGMKGMFTKPYAHLPDPKTVGPGKAFTQAQKNKIIIENKAANNGVITSDLSGTQATQAQQSKKGVTPPINEAQVDHIIPKSKGGTNSYENAQVLTREENLIKGNTLNE